MKLVLAEDDPTTRSVLMATLKRWGYQVQAACDGLEAWEALRQDHAPKLGLVDWMMPGLDGLEVCRKVRAQLTVEAPYLILLTARGQKGDIVEGLRAGANDYVCKPYDNEELQARLEVGKRMVELQSALAGRVAELQHALAHIKRLQGILPICMHCHRIRTDQASWERVENYISEHSEAQFSHGLCPECREQYYPAIPVRPPLSEAASA
jgi:phosphoserine phosphatase RsbU/P